MSLCKMLTGAGKYRLSSAMTASDRHTAGHRALARDKHAHMACCQGSATGECCYFGFKTLSRLLKACTAAFMAWFPFMSFKRMHCATAERFGAS